MPSRGKASIGAEAASADDAVLLGVAPGEPMLVERRLIFDQRGRPLERTESRYAAARYGFERRLLGRGQRCRDRCPGGLKAPG